MQGWNEQRKPATQSGQSLIEFVITLFAFFTMIFMYVQVALSLGVANYIQYATFIAGRAFLAGHASEKDQEAAARRLSDRMLMKDGQDRFSSIIKSVETRVLGSANVPPPTSPDVRNRAWEQGVTFKFNAKLYMLPLLRSVSSKSTIELESQGLLGREPSQEDCQNYLEDRKRKTGAQEVLFDNGC